MVVVLCKSLSKGIKLMNRFLCFLCLTAIAVGAMAMPLYADSVWGTWTGAADTNYYNPLNWNGNGSEEAHPDGVSNNWLRVDINDATAPVINTEAPWGTYNFWIGSIYSPNPVGPAPWYDGYPTPTTTAGKLTVENGGHLIVYYDFDVGGGVVTGGTSSLIMTGNAHVEHMSAYQVRMGINGGQAALTMSGTSEFDKWNGGDMLFGVNDASAPSASSCVATLSDSAFLYTSAHYRIGDTASYGGTGTVAATGSITMTDGSHVQNWNRQIVIGSGGMADGSVTLTGDGLTAGVQPLFENIGSGTFTWITTFGGNGSLSLTNASYTEANVIEMSIGGGTAALNVTTTPGSLTPSILSTGGINCNYASYPSGTATVTIENSTVKAMLSNDTFIDSGAGFNVYLSGNVNFNTNGFDIGVHSGLQQGATAASLTKTSLGNLTLYGANTYTGNTVVNAGQLTLANSCSFPAGTPNEIQVNTGAALGSDYNGGSFNANVTFGNLSSFRIGTYNTPPDGFTVVGTMTVNNVAAVNAGDKVLVDFSGTPNISTLVGGSLPVIAYATRGNAPQYITPVDSYGTVDFAVNDTYTSGVGGTVSVSLIDKGGSRGWQGPTSNTNWLVNGNWIEGTAPNGTDARAWFDDRSWPSNNSYTCVLNGDATVSSLLFNGGFTIEKDIDNHSLTMQTSIALNTQIQVLAGNSVVNPDIKMAGGDPIVSVANNMSLTLNGVLSNLNANAAAITFNGNGAGASQTPTYGILTLNGLNTFTGPVVMSGYGRLEVSSIGLTSVPNTLGQSGPDAANLVINGFLAYTGTASVPTTVTTDRGFTMAGAGVLDGIDVQDANVNLKFNGLIEKTGVNAFRKLGVGSVTFANAGVNTLIDGDLQIEEGSVVFDAGTFNKAHVNIGFQSGFGDVYVGDTPGKSAALVVQNGATLNLNGGPAVLVGISGGTGSLTVEDGATLNVNGSNDIDAGVYAGSVGNYILNGSGKIVSASHYRIGYDSGIGTITMNGSSRITNWGHQIVLGNFGSASGSIIMNGDGLTAGVQPVFEQLGPGTITWVGPGAGVTGTISITNAKYTEAGYIVVGGSGGNGTITVATTPGSLNPARLDIAAYLLLAYNDGSGIAQVDVSEGSTLTAGGWVGIGYNDGTPGGVGGHSVLNNSGTVHKSTVFSGNIGFLIVGRNQDAEINQNAGSFTDDTVTCLGQWGNKGTLNLNGGVFSTIAIQVGYWAEDIAKGEINFDGGTLKANAASQYAPAPGGAITLFTPFASAAGNANIYVKNGGAIIDTSGFNASILSPLQTSADPLEQGGGLIKIGAGTLNLVGGNTYTGDTIVNEGALNIPAINTPSSMVYVAVDSTLNASSIVADSLYIGGNPLPLPKASNTAAVPEPGTFVLLALAGLALVGAYIRRK
jgi:fibronectin-binding autotransporter adhesin